MRKSFAERLWSKVDVRGPDECWEWQGGRGSSGYGQIFVLGSLKKAHRVAYELTNGPIPDGLLGCHTCDNPPCCNPAHVFPGTHGDNVADMILKGRHRCARGENNPRARLSWSEVESIRALYACGDISQQALAVRFGVSRTAIGDIVRGVHWPDPNYRPARLTNAGERNGNARLTSEQVSVIRARYSAEELTELELAELFGVSKSAISLVVRGDRWAPVEVMAG